MQKQYCHYMAQPQQIHIRGDQGTLIDEFTINLIPGKPDHTLKDNDCPTGGSG